MSCVLTRSPHLAINVPLIPCQLLHQVLRRRSSQGHVSNLTTSTMIGGGESRAATLTQLCNKNRNLYNDQQHTNDDIS